MKKERDYYLTSYQNVIMFDYNIFFYVPQVFREFENLKKSI